jgi:hypothetical protein
VLACGGASAADPKIAPGRDPGGEAVAILADGFDTTRSDLLRVLARDGEGEAIAWDAADGDRLPLAKDGHGTSLALAAAALGGVRLIPVRVGQGDTGALARGIAFAVATPARIVLLALPPGRPAASDMLRAAAAKFPDVLFVVAVREGLPPDRPANVIAIASAGQPMVDVSVRAADSASGAAQSVARAVGCGGGLGEISRGEAKRVYLERLGPAPLADPPECEKKAADGQSGK